MDNVLVDKSHDPTVVTGSITNNKPLYVGIKYSQQAYNLVGKLDELRIYDRVLSAEEIDDFYNYAPSYGC